jgi:Tol biopolymer transport system component
LKGAPVPMLDGVVQSANAPNTDYESGIGQFAVSRSGSLVYATGGIYPSRSGSLVRVDRKGTITDLKLKGNLFFERLSPDGQRLVAKNVTFSDARLTNIELFDLARGTSTRFTSEGDEDHPVWSPDGKRIAFASGRNVVSAPMNGQGTRETVLSGRNEVSPTSWSPDGKWLANATARPNSVFSRCRGEESRGCFPTRRPI